LCQDIAFPEKPIRLVYFSFVPVHPIHTRQAAKVMQQNHILSRLPGATLILNAMCALAFAAGSPASDLERERRLAEQTVDAIFEGEPLMLNATGHEFLGIYTRAETAPERGAAIILHGRGTHPDWEQVAGPLRKALPAHGWSTLSLQMPVLDKDASYYDYVENMPEAPPRIEAALGYLRNLGTDRIILIAHSCGVHMIMAWIRQHGDAGIDAYIGIGMGATDYQQPMRQPFPFDRIRVPLLNIYGEGDYPAVQRQAAQLEPMLAQINRRSAQHRIPGAGHYFNGHETELSAVISNWLDTLFPQKNQPGEGGGRYRGTDREEPDAPVCQRSRAAPSEPESTTGECSTRSMPLQSVKSMDSRLPLISSMMMRLRLPCAKTSALTWIS